MDRKELVTLWQEFKEFVRNENRKTWKDAHLLGEHPDDEYLQEVSFDNFMAWLSNSLQ